MFWEGICFALGSTNLEAKQGLLSRHANAYSCVTHKRYRWSLAEHALPCLISPTCYCFLPLRRPWDKKGLQKTARYYTQTHTHTCRHLFPHCCGAMLLWSCNDVCCTMCGSQVVAVVVLQPQTPVWWRGSPRSRWADSSLFYRWGVEGLGSYLSNISLFHRIHAYLLCKRWDLNSSVWFDPFFDVQSRSCHVLCLAVLRLWSTWFIS